MAAKGAIVWVQDYQLQLVPKMLRELRPDLRIGFFLHIPFPPVELFQQLPWRRADPRGPARRRPVGFQLPERGRQLRPAGSAAAGRADLAPRTSSGRRSHRPGRGVPDLGRRRRAARSWSPAGGPGSGRRRSARSSANPERCCSGSTGWTTPRASSSGCRRSGSCSRRVDLSRARRCSCRSRRRAGSASSSTAFSATTSSCQVGRLNGEFAELGPGRQLHAHVVPA